MGKKHTILVVDDDDMNLQMAEFILKKEMDVDVVLAESGYKCIAFLQKKMAIDLILLDIQMPRMDGIKTLETIRSHAEWKDIPVIFLTASADRNTVVKASQLKVDDYIKKSSIISYSREALEAVHKDIELFARKEGLTAHETSIKVRFE